MKMKVFGYFTQLVLPKRKLLYKKGEEETRRGIAVRRGGVFPFI